MGKSSLGKSKGSLKYRNNETVQEEVQEEDTEEIINTDKDAGDESDSGKHGESIKEEVKYDLSDSGNGRKDSGKGRLDESIKEDFKYELSESNVAALHLEDKLQDRTLDQSEELMMAYDKKIGDES